MMMIVIKRDGKREEFNKNKIGLARSEEHTSELQSHS